jgi:hypothetical protein
MEARKWGHDNTANQQGQSRRLMPLGKHACTSGDRRAKRTHFGELIGVENGPTVAVSGSFELLWFEASGAKDAKGGRLRTDQTCSS